MIVINPRLPAGYTELTYVQAGSGSYIDLGIKGDNTTVAYVKAKIIRLNSQVQYTPFGVWDTTKGVQPNLSYDTTNRNSRFGEAVTQTTHLTDLDIDMYFGPDKMSINGTDYPWTGEVGTFETESTMFLFVGRRAGTSGYDDGTSQISEAKFYSGTTPVREMVPAIRNSDSEVGMYDLVSDTFFTNAGTGSFTAGPKVRFIKSIGTFPGINLWNETWEQGSISLTSGANATATNRIRSKGLIPVDPETDYYYYNGAGTGDYVLFYGENGTYLVDYVNIVNDEFTTPEGCHFVRFYTSASYGGTYNNDITINISNPDVDGHYYPYIKQFKSIAIGDDVIWTAPLAMRSIESDPDQLTIEEEVAEDEPSEQS